MLGQAEVFAGNISKGRPLLEQGIQHGERLRQLSPIAGNECLIGCYTGLVAVEFSSANPSGAISFLNRQLEHAKALAQLENTPVAQLNIINAKLSLATAQLQSGDAPKAMRTAEELAAEAEKMIGPKDESYQRLRLRILDLIGDIAGNPRDIHLLNRQLALSSYRDALAIAEHNFSRDPQDARYRRDLDRALRKLALLVVDEDADQATRLAQRALTLSEIHLKNSPGNPEYMRDQIDGLLILGYASETRKHWPEALVFLQKALSQQLDLQRGSPETRRFKREIQETQEALGDVYLQLGRTKEALASYEKGLELTVSMLWERPTDAYLLRDLTDNHEALAEYYVALAGQGGPQAREHWKKAVEYQRKSVEAWSDWPKKVASGPYPSMRLEEAKKTLDTYEKAAAR
jgi:tetratricopeptide (TPR) repeat protein